ncbi:hypothetical protein AB6H14_19705 [Providencia vermicola]
MKLKGLVLVSLGACSYGILSTLVVLAYQAGFSLNDVIGSQTVLGAALLWVFVLAGSAMRKNAKLANRKASNINVIDGNHYWVNGTTLLRLITVFITGIGGCAIFAVHLDGSRD